MADILRFDGMTFLPESPESVLDKAKEWGMTRCMIVGSNENGDLVFGGSFADAGDMVLLLELAKKFVLDNNIARHA